YQQAVTAEVRFDLPGLIRRDYLPLGFALGSRLRRPLLGQGLPNPLTMSRTSPGHLLRTRECLVRRPSE
ncbi:MAG: hypothetical protein ACYSUI_14150, partial [Planctomycetota bacterium]